MPGRARYIDVTRPIRQRMRTYPGDPRVRIDRVSDTRRGDAANVSLIRIGSHTGTHVDAGRHLAGLGGGVESLPLSALIGPARVVQAARRRLGPGDIPALRRGGAGRLLLRGRAALLPDAARRIARMGVVLVGTDGMSIDPAGDDDLPAHRILLEAGIVLIENLDLTHAPPGRYELIALPLLIPGADGAPVRALLRPRSALLRRPAAQRRK